MGCLATTQVAGGVKAEMGNALGLQRVAWNVQAKLFLQALGPADLQTVFLIPWLEPKPKGQYLRCEPHSLPRSAQCPLIRAGCANGAHVCLYKIEATVVIVF